MTRYLAVAMVTAVGLAGCGGAGEAKSDPVAVTAKVTMNGAPVADVICCFVPHTAKQTPGDFPLDAGGNLLKGNVGEPKLIPGKYSIYFQQQGNKAAAFKKIPAKFTEIGQPAIEVEVKSSGGEIPIAVG